MDIVLKRLEMPAAKMPVQRLKLTIRGAVQGVGFRPFVFRLASELKLRGWVNNSSQGVFIEIEGLRAGLENFLLRLESEKPPCSFIQSLEASWFDPVGYAGFEIRESETGGDKTALVLPDIATCPDCLREIFDPNNRRYRYPFTNCTNCGPRFSIIESLPYDRTNTSMKSFTMCSQCQAEYEEPANRRFHAQPNACPVCGPHLELWNAGGEGLFACHKALLAAAQAIRRGRVVAIKGLGGFHLVADARNDQPVQLLRERKHREEKPFALMFPSLDAIKAVCEVSVSEERLLRSPESPIVLLKRTAKQKSPIANAVAPGNPYLGVMLPYTPLHHLLMDELSIPVVATSGNLSDEPICTDEYEAIERLGGVGDLFLIHNRPIVRHVDDSIVRVMLGREMILRRARGFAPLPISSGPNVQNPKSKTVLAVGAHLKNTVALSVGNQVFISQHIGDLETEQAHNAFRHVIADLEKLYDATPQIIAADLHPDYLSTRYAQEIARAERPLGPDAKQRVPTVIDVQHHSAHILSCMVENEIAPPALGVSWDGTGYGLDGTIWGGEFFLVTDKTVERVAHLRPFRLPGGEHAMKEPRRVALGLLYELFGKAVFDRADLPLLAAFCGAELSTLKAMLTKELNSPVTTSIGRLFDAVASLANLRQQMRFEGQAAMELEFAMEGIKTDAAYELRIVDRGLRTGSKSEIRNLKSEMVLDWSSLIEAILADVKSGIHVGRISAKFHNALVEAIVAVATHAGQNRVILSGGCFQNRYLTERAAKRLQAEGFRPAWHQRVPPNDGGIALGQVVAAKRLTC